MNYTVFAVITCTTLFGGMLLVSNVAYRLGRRRFQKGETSSESTGLVSGAIFSLMGLLIAFTFYGAYSRLDIRRQLIVQEANAIGTAYLRLDLIPSAARAPLREKLQKYAVSRAVLFEKLTNVPAALSEIAKSIKLQKEIWTLAVAATNGPESHTGRMLLLPALNEMIDIATTRTIAMQAHPPLLIFLTLYVFAVICAGITGHRAGATAQTANLYSLAFAFVTALILYLILDIEYVRYGLIRLDKVNNVLVELAKMMQ